MASIYDIKPAFQNLLRPLTGALARAGVTANQVTVAAAVLSCAVGACVQFSPFESWPLLVMPGFLFVRMALNAIDGMLAREHAMKSKLGAILNEVGDVISDTALYLPLAAVPGFYAPLVVIAVVLAVISELTGIVGVQIGASRRYDGPMGKSDRAFAFGLLALLVGVGLISDTAILSLQLLVVVLLVATIVNRGRRALAESKGKP
ncbi:MAG TPA: CDP-alcohol phosphatidyltransferase family protein [Opitutaceae bacterium]|nr:CDP-alcohol phosphatidyltransferase family protein [Opitutaceae bacterium]